jgi:hypothetical protein
MHYFSRWLSLAIGILFILALCSWQRLPVVKAQAPTCTAPPPGMVGWSPGEANAKDIRRENNGALPGKRICESD